MSEASRWLDGFAVSAKLLGMSRDEIAGALPPGTPTPPWLDAMERQTSREARAQLLAAPIARLRSAVRSARPGWR